MTNINFGECLYLLISTLDISMNQLSKAINVDSSLVSRWVSGKRIPAYNTIYIESITEYLSKNIRNSFQEQNINKLFLNVNNSNNKLNYSIKEKIMKMLLESQGYSIECKKKENKENKILSSINKDHTLNLMNIDPYYSQEQDNIKDLNQTISLSNEDKIVFGIENIISAGISLLESAINHESKDNKIIYITYNGISATDNYHHKLIQWRNALLNAINNGWEVIFLIRLDNDINRIIRFIKFIYPVIITGKFNLYYFNKYGVSNTSKETYVVSDVGALSCFPTESNSEITCSFYLKNKSGVNVFKDYFNAMITNLTRPLIKYYPKDIEYYLQLTELEENIGNRFQYKYSFSIFTLTENLFRKFLERKKLSNDEILILLDFHKRQSNAFLSGIQQYQYRDIYLVNSIEDLVIQKMFYFDYYGETEIMTLEVKDIIEILQNIIFLLKTYDNYNIAFMTKNADSFLKNVNSYFIVKERHAVIFETFNTINPPSEVRLYIEEDTLTKAFDEYFKQTWEHIAPVNKDKKEIIKMLENHIDTLKNSYGENLNDES